MNKKILRAFMVTFIGLLLMNSLIEPSYTDKTVPFVDINNSFAYTEIINLHEQNIMNGTGTNTFSPTRSMTRAEWIAVMMRSFNLSPVSGGIPAFVDVPEQAWYYGSVQAATQLGLTKGTSSITFAPNASISRQEAATLLSRMLKVNVTVTAQGQSSSFLDNGLIASWALPYVSRIQQLGIMQGSQGLFRPNDDITRQEAAVMISRVLNNKAWANEIKGKATANIELGWQYSQTTNEYQSTVLKSNVNVISPRWYFLENGTISDRTDTSMLKWAKKNGKQVWALLGNNFNAEMTHQMLSDKQKSALVVNQLADIVIKYDLDGLNIDFENVMPEDRNGFTAFVAQLSNKLNRLGAVLAVDLSPELGTDWTAAFDSASLRRYADYIVLMAYEQYWSGSPTAGSVSSLSWVTSALDELLTKVPANQIIMALPLYSRDWTVGADGRTISSVDVSLPEQNKLMHKYSIRTEWNEALGQYTGSYILNGVKHRLWFEDSRSLTMKYQMALDRNVAGFAYWYMGGASDDVWPSLANVGRYKGYEF